MLGGCFDQGTEKEGIRIGNGEQDFAGVDDRLCSAGGCEEFGKKREGRGFSGSNDLAMNLLERLNPVAGEEEEVVER